MYQNNLKPTVVDYVADCFWNFVNKDEAEKDALVRKGLMMTAAAILIVTLVVNSI